MADTGASAVFIAAPEGDAGKSTVALGVLRLLSAKVARVGVFRPITSTVGGGPDQILQMLLEHASADIDYADAIGVDYGQVHADPEAAIAEIVTRFHQVADQCDAVVILGSDYSDVTSPSELRFNARIAANLGAPVLLILRGLGRSPQHIAEVARLCQDELAVEHAELLALVVNRADPERLDEVTTALAAMGVPRWALPEEPLLNAPTVAELRAALGARLYSGDPQLLRREAMQVMVGGMTVENVLTHLTDAAVVIVPGDRCDVLLGLVNAHEVEGFPSLAGIVLNGGLLPDPTVARLLEAMHPRLPILATDLGTFDTASTAARTRGRMSPASTRKVDTALSLMEKHVDGAALTELISVAPPTVVTPQMFEYRLIEQARRDRRRIVLPEGDDDRILRAAGRVLQRSIADLTILGDEATVRGRAAELGVDISSARVINPATSSLREQFAQRYAQLRGDRGVTVERAREIMGDISYFATMMVSEGMADGMVSGAAHTTAHTIRPALRIIGTAPGFSTVSSVFLMCLPDRVLVYGDCAVVPEPTATQLADIAVSAAQTAVRFGIEPKVAMLSYSTGESGSGTGVEKVRAATALVRERAPKLPVAGPIQYDAAVEPAVALAKVPDSEVAGHATVFVFPDLNTGNNTYKAVQRSAGVVAIGPVLQGLRRPVNDLSRGALVADIVNTIAITAIQAGIGVAAPAPSQRNDLPAPTKPKARVTPTAKLMVAGRVLVLNSGSSSIKYKLLQPDSGVVAASGEVSRIGEPVSEDEPTLEHHCNGDLRVHHGPVADHHSGLQLAFDLLREGGALTEPLQAVGHRVVHGGPRFHRPTLLTDTIVAEIEELSELAPLHNPANVLGIRSARALLPDTPQVAVFDTAFFHALPAAARTYAIDAQLASRYAIRRYGFHGTSHEYVSGQVAQLLGRDPTTLNQIVLHLGNGASAAALRAGRPVDTSMGLTPLEGLVMGTRCGDLDPGVIGHLGRVAGYDVAHIDELLNRHSGLVGLTGVNDFRRVVELVDAGDAAARLAYDVYVHRLRRYVGAYVLQLGRVDAITFTAGVGEHSAVLRADALAGLERFGIRVDSAANTANSKAARVISPRDSDVTVLVVPTDEELAIARAAAALTAGELVNAAPGPDRR